MPVRRNDHQIQFPDTPLLRTMSVTRFGVSVEKVVATIEMPSIHHGIDRPLRKNDLKLLPALRDTTIPTVSEKRKKAAIMAQSNVDSCIAGGSREDEQWKVINSFELRTFEVCIRHSFCLIMESSSPNKTRRNMDRRLFIKTGALAGVGASVAGNMESSATPNATKAPFIRRGVDDRSVNLGFIGVGLRGRSHVGRILKRNDCNVVAICDIDADAIAATQKTIQKAGASDAAVYTGSEFAFEKLLERDDIDGVIIATPWLWHTRMSVATMKAGKYAGVEVSASNTIEECWDLVNTYEETGSPCMILENVCYRRDVMAILNMVRREMFGELLHMECGYQHDLRAVKFNNGSQPYGGGVEFGENAYSEAKWRTDHSVYRNGDIYPTHGIGPIGVYANINRGNRFLSLTSTASKARGLHKYIVDQAGEDHPNASVRFKLGDVITTVIETQMGESIIVSHDTNSPRPYSLGFRVQGTEGLWMDLNKSIYLQGKSPEHQWEDAEEYLKQYDHPLWKKYGETAQGAGHGGMDFFVDHAFVESIKRGVDTPLDAYDAAAWSAITPLSERSISEGSAPQPFPDFTRGRWMTRKPVFALDDEF